MGNSVKAKGKSQDTSDVDARTGVTKSSWVSLALILNRQGKIKFITKELAFLLGYSVNEMLGQDAIELFVDKGDIDERRSQLDFLYKQDSVIDAFDIMIKSRHGTPVKIRFSIITLPSVNSAAEDIALVGDNLASTTRIKTALKDEANQAAEILDSAKEFIIIIDKDEKISTVNEVGRNKLGIKVGTSLKEMLEPTDAKRTTSFLNSLGNISSNANINLLLLHPVTKQRFYLAGSVSSIVERGVLENFRLVLHDVTEKTKSEKAKDLYYSIAHHSIHSRSLDELYHNIHKELKAVVDCENLYIALIDSEKDEQMLAFPYYQEGGITSNTRPPRKFGKGLTEYIIKAQKPQLFTRKELLRLAQKDKIVLHGTMPDIWLGVPLRVKNEVIGAIAVQSFHNKSIYTGRDLKLLDFASSQIAMAIDMVRTQEELKSQTAKLNSIIESGSQLIWTVNSKLELTSYNKNYFETILTNYNRLPSVLEGTSDANRKYPEWWDEKYKDAFEGQQVNFEIKLKDNTNKDIWKEIYLNPIFLDDNKIEEVSAIANDITEKKISEQALIESEEKFRNIFESFQDVYFRCDRNARVKMVSPSVEDITGRSVNEVLGEKISNFIHAKESLLPMLKKLLESNEIKNVELTVSDIEGKLVEGICNLRLIKEAHTGEMLIEGILRDVTLLKLTNRELIEAKDLAEESLMVKEQFLANMSHEIRTPLNGIIGVLDLLDQTKLNSQQYSYLKTIKTSSETLLNILNDILDLSKIEAGKMQLRPEPFSTKNLIRRIKALFASRAATKLIKLNLHVSSKIPLFLEADALRIIQVISNLLANSIKFTSRGGSIDLGFELKKENKEFVTVRVDVRDSGIGISKEDVNKLFTNFTQLDTSTTKAYGGTGLGLSIAKQLVELMGGQIGVSSSPGLGSTFWFSFKAKKTTKTFDEPTDLIMNDNKIYHFKKAPAILVVDDNLVNRDVAGEILKKSGCKVELASNGVEAVLKAKSNYFDIIFMDIQMPEMDGIEANKQIKSLGLQKSPRIVAMTAYSMKEDEQRFLKEGLDDYIAKPIRAAQLISKVRSIMSGNKEVEIAIDSEQEELKIINTEILEQLQKYGGKEMVSNTLREFEDEAGTQIKECLDSLSENNFEVIQKHLHTLKGSAGTLGIEKVAEIAKTVEGKMKTEDYSEVSEGLRRLNDSFVEFKENFSNIVRNY